MSAASAAAAHAAARLERRAGVVFWSALVLGWLVAVFYMWDAVTTTPPAGASEASSVVGDPTIRTFVTAVIFSGMELGIVLAALWPGKPDYYATRLAVAALALATWLIMASPVDLTRLDWVHRRWLAFMAGAVVLALLGLLAYRGWQRLSDRDGEAGRAAIRR